PAGTPARATLGPRSEGDTGMLRQALEHDRGHEKGPLDGRPTGGRTACQVSGARCRQVNGYWRRERVDTRTRCGRDAPSPRPVSEEVAPGSDVVAAGSGVHSCDM